MCPHHSENGPPRGPALPPWLGLLLACLLAIGPCKLAADSWTTLAGPKDGVGHRDGYVADARFASPNSATVDATGNVYVADTQNAVIRKITPNGVVITVAGLVGSVDLRDGIGSAARFEAPDGITVDGSGNVYVTDNGTSIRKVTPAGVVTTVAGGKATGGVDGPGASARFHGPSGIAVDRSGDIYVADSNNAVIRKVNQAGVVTTFAGRMGIEGSQDGTGAGATFNRPSRMGIDGNGNLYVNDSWTVRKITPSGVVTTLAGSPFQRGSVDGNRTNARFNDIYGVAVGGNGNVYVAEKNLVRRITPAGDVTTIAGIKDVTGGVDGPFGTATFGALWCLAPNQSDGLLAVDKLNSSIRKVGFDGSVSTLAGRELVGHADGVGEQARFAGTSTLAVDAAGNVYVYDSISGTIRKVTPSGVVTTLAGSPFQFGYVDGRGSSVRLSQVGGIAVNSATGIVYFTQGTPNLIRQITPDGTVSTLAGSGSSGAADGIGAAASFVNPRELVIDYAGNLYVSDGSRMVRKVTPNGVVTTVAGKTVSGYVDGPSSQALFGSLFGLTVDSGDNLFAADRGYDGIFVEKIRKITQSGMVSSVMSTKPGAVDNLALDTGGNFYSVGGRWVRKFSSEGVSGVFAGNPSSAPAASDGSRTTVRFSDLTAIAMGPGNRLYVADQVSSNIRVGQIETGPVRITGQPSNAAVKPGLPVQFSVAASGEEPITYQWRKGGVNIAGATDAVLSFSTAQLSDGGAYEVVVKNNVNSVTSVAVILTVSDVLPTLPVISGGPSSVRVTAGSSASFSATATGSAPLSYQWRRGGLPVAGGTGSVLAFAATEETDAGVYSVAVSNLAGTVVSGTATLTVDPQKRVAPAITSQPLGQTVYPGISATFRVAATGSPLPTYQWRKSGVDIPGATGREYFIPAVQSNDAAAYEVVVQNEVGSVTSVPAKLALVSVAPPVLGLWSTYAGAAGGVGAVDDTGGAARFAYLQGVAVDGGGTLYVADTANHAVRKITPAGVVTTLAGSLGVSGSVNGAGSAARFHSPQGVAVVGGTVYVSDTGTHTIRKITAEGVVTTLAGGMLVPGSNDGSGTVAKFNKPWRLAADSSGNLLVADHLNHAIRRVTPGGVVTTLAGGAAYAGSSDGTLLTARFNRPSDIALDAAGNAYVLDSGNKSIRKIDTAGNVTLLAGSAGYSGTVDGTGTAARFDTPIAIAVDAAATVYVADKHRLRRISPDGAVTTIAGATLAGNTDNTGLAARFSNPQGLCWSAGTLYVGDTGNSLVRRMVLSSGTLGTVAGASAAGSLDGLSTQARFNAPRAVVADAFGVLYVADTGNHVIRKVDLAGNVTTLAGGSGAADFADGTGGEARFNAPQSLLVDLAGNLMVADTGNHAIRRVTPGGVVTTFAGAGGLAGSSDGQGTAARFWSPRSVAQDAAGNLYVADGRNFTIRKILPSGVVTTLAGSTGSAGQQDGTGAGARFVSPTAVAVDANGEVSVADGSTIRRISAGGVVTTVAGSLSFSGTLDGKGSAAAFGAPQGLALDPVGNLYVADTFNHTIRKVDPSGTVTTLAGGPGRPGSADGAVPAVRFAYPSGISLDATGNLFVADMDNARIRLGALGNRPIVLPVPPKSTTAVVGGSAVLTVVANGPGPFTYQWRKEGVNVAGATAAAYVLSGLQASDGGFYDVIVGNASGAVASSGAVLAVSQVPLEPVTFAQQPQSQTVAVGNAASFRVTVSGTEPITYQWRRDGVALAGATDNTLNLNSIQTFDGGSYDVVVSNPVGSVASLPAKLTVDLGLLPVSIRSRPLPQTVFPGAPASFSVDAVGTAPLTYQWRKNGEAIAGATASSYTIASVQTADLGNYSVRVTGGHGDPVISPDAALSFDLTPPAGGSWVVLAGTAGGAGSRDGTGSAAQFNYPRRITVDPGSNLYVSDTQSHTIRKITPSGGVSLLAGVPGSGGVENGQLLQARFRSPQGLAVDAGSNLYVADTGNHVIRKISPSGRVSTFAGGTGLPGNNDGTEGQARFNSPQGVAVVGGTVYVADAGNHLIRSISSSGVVTTVAGGAGLAGGTDERGGNARFNSPGDLAADAAGNLYVLDSGNRTIRKITPGGVVSTIAGRAGFYGTNDGIADQARFAAPSALTADASGNLWVLDGHRLRSVSTTGRVETLAGGFVAGATDAAGTGAEFFNPAGLCRAPNGTLYIADTGNSVIRAVGAGAVVTTFAGASSSGNAEGVATAARFHSPRGAARDGAGNVYIADAGNHTIRKVTLSGVVTTLAGDGVAGSVDGNAANARFRAPEAVAVDVAGNVFVADTGNHTLRVISPEGLVSTLAGAAGLKGSVDGVGVVARFSQPRGVALDAAGNLYVSDAGNFALRKVTPAGVVSTFAGSMGASGTADGTGGAARLSGPGALLPEGGGSFLFTDGSAIRRVGAGGAVSTVAGRPRQTGFLDGVTAAALFASPQGLAVDSSGTIFVSDTFNHVVRKISPGGIVSTLAGAAGSTGSADGVGTEVRFAFPWGLCDDGLGNLVLTDLDNSKVRLGMLRDTPLQIRAQPRGATVFEGQPVILHVVASGIGPLTYQWSKNGTPLDGATFPQYVLSGVGPQDVGQYTVAVGNLAGSRTSEIAEVRLNAEPPTPVRIVLQPASRIVRVGYAAVFSVTAEGTGPLRYQWRKNGSNIVGANSASHTILAVSPLDAGSYDVLVFNGSSAATSDPVTLTVNDVGNAPPVIVNQPGSVVRYPGVPAVFTVGATGAPPLRFQWRKSGVEIAGGTGSTLTVSGKSAGDAGTYDVVVSNDAGAPATSVQATFSFTDTPPPSGMWSTVAGAPGGPGSDDGTAEDARFNRPRGLAYDASGNAYVADTGNHTIRKVSSAGEVSTFAGIAGSSGALDGQGAGARFNAPQGVTVDGAGNVYVADTGNQLIRKITPAGVVSTLAGFPTYVGRADGMGDAARFNFPVALAADADGYLYVADRENHVIRMVSPEGLVTTLAGYAGNSGFRDGSGLEARLNRPGGIVLRSLGGAGYELIIADTGNRVIRRMTPSGVVSTLAGGVGLTGIVDGIGTAARFGGPTSLAASAAGVVYIADGNRIRMLSLATGAVGPFTGGSTAGNSDLSLGTSAFSAPQGLVLRADGNLLVADTGNATLRLINPVEDSVVTFAGRASAGAGDGIGAAARFRAPSAAVLDTEGNLYVADTGNHTIRKVTVSGEVTTLAGAAGMSGYADGTDSEARFSSPRGLALAANGDLYVADSGNHLIRVISPRGIVTTFAGVAGLPGSVDGFRDKARFSVPVGLALDRDGNLYVADSFNVCIRKITPAGVVGTLAGSPGASGALDGPANVARFVSPVAVVVDAAGNLYVADFNAIRKVTPGGMVSTLAGAPFAAGSLDGTGSGAGFAAPAALAIDGAGDLFVADTGNHLVRKVTAAGVVSTLGGNLAWAGSGEGLGAGVRFSAPSGIAVDAFGNLCVVDADGARVRFGMLSSTPLQIVSQPRDATTFLNGTTIFRVGATGPAPISYQWRKDGQPIVGATAPMYRISPTMLDAAGSYSVTVSNLVTTAVGKGSPTSREAVLTVEPIALTPLSITSQPAGLSVVVGNSGTLSVEVAGSVPRAYQWRKNRMPIQGASGPQLVIAAARFSDSGQYDVVIENPVGRITSAEATLVVTAPIPGAPLIGSQTTLQKVSPGAAATFSVAAIGTGPFTYQWFKDGVGIPGATDPTYTLPAVYARDLGRFKVSVSNAGGTSSSDEAELSLNLVPPASGIWSTLAGPSGVPGSLDSLEPGEARFNYPRGVALAAGTLYVADTNNHTIRKVFPSGETRTVAGVAGLPGNADGPAELAGFNAPSALALDAAGNLYVADTGNHLIRMISPEGQVTTVAGTANKSGFLDGPVLVARFNGPRALVATAGGTLYVADTGNSVIRMIIRGGSVSTFAGIAGSFGHRDDNASLSLFNQPTGITLDAAGSLYVADTGNRVVRKIDSDRIVTTLAGSPGFAGTADGLAAAARFSHPIALSSDAAGNLFVLDANRLRAVSAAGLVTTPAGDTGPGFANATGGAARFSSPQGVAADGAGGAYIADTLNSLLRRVTSGGSASTVAGAPASGAVDSDLPDAVRFNLPRGLAQDPQGNTYLADSANHTIRKVTNSGAATTLAGAPGVAGAADGQAASARFNAPQAVAPDAAGNLYVADTGNHCVRLISSVGVVSTFAGTPGSSGRLDGAGTAARFLSPRGIALDAAGNVYVADSGNFTIRKITPDGQVTTLAGAPGASGSLDGAGSGARFTAPVAIALNAAGKIVVADANAIRSVSPFGNVTTLAGVAGVRGAADGTGATALFSSPQGVALDAAGNVYVADTYNQTIRKVSSGGVVTTLAGAVGITGSTEGIGTVARFAYPAGICVDALGNLVVTEWDSARVRLGALVDAPLLIRTHPVDTAVQEGTPASFSVTATGAAPFTYRWRKAGVEIPGAVGPTLRLVNAQIADAALYDVVVKDVRSSATSDPARLNVYTAQQLEVALTQQPVAVVVSEGGSAQFTVGANSVLPLTYQWSRNGAPIAGANAAALLLSGVSVADAGTYSVTVGHAYSSATSTGAELVVNPRPPGVPSVEILTQPRNLGVNPGGRATFSVVATGPGTLSYQWLKNGAPITGATGASYSVASAQSGDAGAYSVVITSSSVGSATSASATLTVAPVGAPVIVGDPASVSVSEGDSAVFTVAANGEAPLRYQWRRNGVPLANANYLSYKILSVSAANAGNYDVVVSNSRGNVTSAVASLATITLVNSAPVITAQPAAVAVFPGVAATFRVGVTGHPAPTFQWRKGGVPIAGSTSASFTIANPAAGDAGNYDVVVANAGGTVTSGTAALTLQSLPKGAGEWLTLAGNSVAGTADGGGSAASFQGPWSAAVDADGTIFVGDGDRIRKVTPSGVVTTVKTGMSLTAAIAVDRDHNILVGDGNAVVRVTQTGGAAIVAGSISARDQHLNGPTGTARFRLIEAIAALSDNTIYVSEGWPPSTGISGCIRKISPDGMVSDFAGSPTNLPGSVDARGSSASFAWPKQLVVSRLGNLYVADMYNHAIRQIAPDASVTRFSGTGSAPDPYWQPQGVAVDAEGTVYVADTLNGRIRRVTGDGAITTIGSGFEMPSRLAVDPDGNVLLPDPVGHKLWIRVSKDIPLQVVYQPAAIAVARGAVGTFTVEARGSLPVSYQWRKNGVPIAGATAPVFSVPSVQPSDTGAYDVVIANGAGAVTSASASLSLNTAAVTPVTLTRQPVKTSVSPGMDVLLGVNATGSAPLTYQWRRDGMDIAGATGSTYSIPAATPASAGYYDVVVTNVAGSVLSDPALVTVGGSTGLRAPSIVAQPASLAVAENDTAEFAVAATGTAPLRYQWRKNGTAIPNANYSRYKILTVRPDATGEYDVVLSNPVGTVTSSAVTLTIFTPGDSAPVITEQPATIAVYPGVAATFRVGVKGHPAPAFQWRKGGVPIAGGTLASYTIPSAAAGDAGSYDVVVTNSVGTVTSSAAVLTLQALPKGAGNWFTLAGNPGGTGQVDGPAASAKFESPGASVADNLGNLFVLDRGLIRKVSKDGVVSTVSGFLSTTFGIAMDTAGNLYVSANSASDGHWVWVVTPSGTARVLAGSQNREGYVNGPGNQALFGTLRGITVVGAVVYVVDEGNSCIRKITSDGTVSTFVGSPVAGLLDGTGEAAQFSVPRGLAHDAAGNLYVAEWGGDRVRKVTPAGQVTHYAGGVNQVGFVDGPSRTARFTSPTDVAVDDSGNVYVADSGNLVVRKIATDGTVSTLAGKVDVPGSTDGQGVNASFGTVASLSSDASGNVFVSDARNFKIRKITSSGLVSTYTGTGGIGRLDGVGTQARFDSPSGVAVDVNGNIFVSDSRSTIRKITPQGVVTTFAGLAGALGSVDGIGTLARFNDPDAMCFDSSGNMYVADSGNSVIRKVSKTGEVSLFAGAVGQGGSADGTLAQARFRDPNGIAIDSAGNLYVADYGNSTVRVISTGGTVRTLAGLAGATGNADGQGSAARFGGPYGIAVDGTGNVYVADYMNDAIRKITPGGLVTTLAGFRFGFDDGKGINASFRHPMGMTVDPAGDLYVVDRNNQRIRRVTPDGTVTSITGTGIPFGEGSEDGEAAKVGFCYPSGIALDRNGQLVVTDTENAKIRVGILNDVPLSILLQPAAIAVTRGAVGTFSVEARGSAPVVYQWRKNGVPIAGATAPVYSVPSVQPSDTGTYDVVIANGAGAVASAPASLNLTTQFIQPVTITAQPRDVVVNLSSPLELSVTAAGTAPLTYQWRKDGEEIPAATAATYSIPVVNLSNEGYYDVVVTNAAGSVLSEPALVEINGMGKVPPSIRTQPSSLQGVAGGFVTFTVGIAGSAPLTYQWRKGGNPIAGATSAAYTINGLRAADADLYDVEVSNRAGSITSEAAVLTVKNPLAIVMQPAPLTVPAGNSALFSVIASGTAPISYQWRRDGQPIAGATASSYEITVAQAVHAGTYDVVVTNPGNNLTSNPAALFVQAGGGGQVVILSQPVNTGALPGGAASFAVSASGTAPLTYQWRKNGFAIAGANGPLYTLGAVQSADVGTYDVVVGNLSGNLTSAPATLSLYSPLGITAQPKAVFVSAGSSATLSVGATGTAPITYQWRKDGQNIVGGTQASYVIRSAVAADVGLYDVVLSNPAGTALSDAVGLAVGAKPVLLKGPEGGATLVGGSLTLSVSATGEGLNYRWRKDGVNLIGATGPVLPLFNLRAKDAGRFEVVVSNAFGAVSPNPAADVAVYVPVTFTRQPEPVLLREGASTTLNAQATGSAPLSYQWRRNGVPIAGATRFSYTVANASAATAGLYDLLVTNPAGSFLSNPARVDVSEALGIVRQPVGASVTQGSAVNLSVVAKGSGVISYQWYKWPASGKGVVVGTLSTLSFSAVTAADAGVYSVLVKGNGPSVSSDRVELSVSAEPGVVVLRQPRDTSFAEGAAAAVRNVVDSGDPAVRETRYKLFYLREGALVAAGAAGVVPEGGILDLSLQELTSSGTCLVKFERLYDDGRSVTASTQPFSVTVRKATEAVGTYEGLLLDANPQGVFNDGALARGRITVSVSRTGAFSGRVQYLEAGSLAGAPVDEMRVYQPVVRTFSGVLESVSETEPFKFAANVRLGVGSQAGRHELVLEMDRGGDLPLLTATLTDKVSLQPTGVITSTAVGLRQTAALGGRLPETYAGVAARYVLSAPASAEAQDNNAQLFVLVLQSGRAIWTSRLTGLSGAGSAGLTAPSGDLLVLPLYEGRLMVGSKLLTSSVLLAELRFIRTLEEGWDLMLGEDHLQQARSKVSATRTTTGFAGTYSATDFAAGTHFTGIRWLDFSGGPALRVDSSLLSTLFGPGVQGLRLVSFDPLAGWGAGLSWSVTVSPTGLVRTSGIVAGGVTPPALSLRLDRVRGQWSGIYVTGGVKRSLFGCVLDAPESRGRGWFESGNTQGRWELRLGP